jgi:hypothetical protein
MNPIRKPSYRTFTMLFLALWALAILLTPPERTLGAVIRWVFVHASLTQAAVYLFLMAALLAAGYLLGNAPAARWMGPVAGIAFAWWLLGFVISIIPARMAWGVWVDFNEPRTQMTLRVIATAVIFLILIWWIANPRFTAVALILFAFILLFLVRSTSLIRHPANPIGSSPDAILPLLYTSATLFAVLAGLSAAAHWQSAAK